MLLVPAIDLLQGGVVRLHQGRFDAVTRYPVDPQALAKSLSGRVARLHVVDLEGSRLGHPVEAKLLAGICDAFGPGVQVGGGVRSRQTAKAYFDLGVSRVVLGTAAVRDSDLVTDLVHEWPESIIIAVDARDGFVSTDGWTSASTLSPAEIANRFAGLPLDSLLFTDISRDGTRKGPALASSAQLAKESGRPVLASGGIGKLEDLRALAGLSGIFGAIVGRALLEGDFTVDAALEALR